MTKWSPLTSNQHSTLQQIDLNKRMTSMDYSM
eukprot:CAMPEP_0176333516 /NCGR_PEP_ID=MMETSP0121_2-20121125/77623_1 /TAXON_ID=160619 /ORGANISM="Kryptoperidinium foliaceum, Strain CCMP 1326" /LENGTH=31 /DNA_ID= /DNA_START= /DNA_END= /DNA_ORIENTATION=